MNNDLVPNLIDLYVIFTHLTSNNSALIHESTRMIASYLARNRKDAEEVLLSLSRFINSNIKSLSIPIIVKIISNILKTLSETNNISITHVTKTFFPLLIGLILFSPWSISEYDSLTKLIGEITLQSGGHAGQLVESHIDSILQKCKGERMEFKYTKYAMISLLKEFVKNCPVVAYNKLIETFDDFMYVVGYYKDTDENIRRNTAEMITHFLELLNNRDYKIKEVYTRKIYNVIESNIIKGSSSVYVIHGTMLVLKALSVRREFFNEKYKLVMDYFYSLRHSRNPIIIVTIVEIVPYFSEYLKEVFEKFYFGNFSILFIKTYIDGYASTALKNVILTSLGKLSLSISNRSFSPIAVEVVNMIKNDFDNNSTVSLSEIDCLASLFVKYHNEVLNRIPFDAILNKIFLSGFYESHVNFLEQLLLVFEENSPEEVQILVIILNVISLIVSSRKFLLVDTIAKLKLLNDSNHLTQSTRKQQTQSSPNYLLQNVRKCINTYINTEEKNKSTFDIAMLRMKRNALVFLKKITHPFFSKDILTFYQTYCVKFLNDPSSKIKLEVMSLATSKWIPSSTSPDSDINYMLNVILDCFLNFIIISQSDEMRKVMLTNLDSRYDALLSKENFFCKFILILNCTDNSIREEAVKILSRLISHNSTIVISFIKTSLMDIFSILESSQDISKKEDAIVLLSYYVKYTAKHIIDYIDMIFSTLIKFLKYEDTESDKDDSSIDDENRISNEILNIHVLSIISELISSDETSDAHCIEDDYKDIILICIANLKENSSSLNQEISLKTILAILEHSDNDWNIYFNFIELVNIIIQILIRTNNKNTRLYGLKIFGFIGTMDPDKLDVLWNIHKNDTDNNTEDYEADEYENFDDEEIVSHNREQAKKNRRLTVDQRTKKSKSMIDFERKISQKEIDPCAYHAVLSLLNILNDDSQIDLCNQVISIFADIIKYLESTDNDKIIVELILNRFLEIINNFNGTVQLRIFDRVLYIVKHFTSICKNHLPELVDLVENFIEEDDAQRTVFSILITMLEQYLDDMETYFNRLVPMLVDMLPEKEDIEKDRVWSIRMKVFQCFTCMSDKLSNFLQLIVPEMISLLNASMIVQKDFSDEENNVYRKEDMEIFAFINKIITIKKFYEQMPKIVVVLMKYMNFCPQAKDIIMGLFMKMLKHLKSDFVCYLPRILRIAKMNNVKIIDYFGEIKTSLESNEMIIHLFTNNSINRHRSDIDTSLSMSVDESNQIVGQTPKSRILKINKDEILSEFNPINCSIEEDWHEWFKSSFKQLFNQSPSYILFCCRNVSEYLSDLYNYAFISVWRTFNQYQKSKMLSYLKAALNSHTTPNEILLTILNLSEYIEREENHIEFIEFDKLAEVAGICKAYAKEFYYTENDFKNNHNINSLESLITIYYELNLPESAMGILKMAQIKNKNIKEDDWYLKLHKWKEALEVILQKRKSDKYNKDLIKGNILCLEGLSDWESMLSVADEVEEELKKDNSEVSHSHEELISKMSPMLAKASLNLNKWDKLKHYISKMNPEEDEEEYEKNFLQAVIAIKEKEFSTAKNFITIARNAIDDKIKTLLSESYERAYKLLLANEHLYELEEIIKYNEDLLALNVHDKNREHFLKEEREYLKHRWDERLEIITEDTNAYERILAIRGLIFPIEEDYDKHLDLAKICRKDDLFAKCMNILERLKKHLVNNKNISIDLQLSLNKCLNENDFAPDSQKALDNLKVIIDDEIDSVDAKLKSKIYCYYAYLNMQKYNKNLTEDKVNNIMHYFELSTKFNSKNYKAWHYFALLNYKYFEFLISTNHPSKNAFALNAIKGFTNSVCIGGKVISKILQDLLRIIEIWFQVGDDKTLIQIIIDSFTKISLDSWLLVIPQLLARVNIKSHLIRESLVEILKLIGLNHPSALIYPLIVMNKSKNEIRSKTAGLILKDISMKYKTLIAECEIIIDELNRCALLFHEKWTEAIEEGAKLYFESNDINGMINLLKEVHEQMNDSPKTINEVHFHQLYSSELNEAKSLLEDYITYNNEVYLKQAWDIYHSVFLSMRENFSNFHFIDLDSISPALANFKQSEICVPGMYRSDYFVVKISGFGKQLTVLNSKQHPRKIIMYGSDGKEYMFLLKGHEDLRQDERAMQLFGLVNALLSSDVDTCDKNLFIKRFPVIALSNNTGILGWVPNCDTLSQLIKEYRISNEIYKDIEQRLLFSRHPRFESATFLSKLEVFKYILDNTLGLDIYKILWIKSKNSEAWLDRRTNYSRSLAVMSMVGYILGLGDRHPSNLMLDRKSGKILHIDFGDCFEVAMKREKFPEKVPFRLTRMLIKALEVSGIEGTFRITCENVMRVLRTNQDSLIAILAAFVHDPLISFRFLIPLILKQTKKNSFTYTNNGNTNASESLKENNPDEIKMIKRSSTNVTMKKVSDTVKKSTEEEIDEMKYEKRRMGSVERQLYNRFTEREQIESEELNKIAKIVLGRIIDKLKGTDFSKIEPLDYKQQVEKLVRQATSHENLCQSYLGWCPFW